MKFLITGGAGFIGSTMINYLLNHTDHKILNVDKLTYASNVNLLEHFNQHSRYQFFRTDICNRRDLDWLLEQFKPDIVMNFAAESHVDRSIHSPADFIKTNIMGTFTLLESALNYWKKLNSKQQQSFCFHHISTDEVYGDIIDTNIKCTEQSPYRPSSPYSASKASSDHLVKAWYRTYGLPIIITNCTNNYGPYQHLEKLIPLTICNALNHKPILLYGNGKQIRDWLYVEDHVRALYLVATKGNRGETYNISSDNTCENIEVIYSICNILATIKPFDYTNLIQFTSDRPGHDFRYSLDRSKIELELGWKPKETFQSGLEKTIEWYYKNLPILSL